MNGPPLIGYLIVAVMLITFVGVCFQQIALLRHLAAWVLLALVAPVRYRRRWLDAVATLAAVDQERDDALGESERLGWALQRSEDQHRGLTEQIARLSLEVAELETRGLNVDGVYDRKLAELREDVRECDLEARRVREELGRAQLTSELNARNAAVQRMLGR